jgi:YD repeat-containing protein
MTAFCRSILILLLFALPLLAQKHPTIELGFNADNLYHYSEIDSVNLFNGNLLLQIPIGDTYHANASFSYQLTLIYNGKMWDYRWQQELVGQQDGQDIYGSYTYTEPNWRSNAGVGWRLSLGRLFNPGEVTSTSTNWVYEGASGDEHTLHQTTNAKVSVSYDQAHLRMVLRDDLDPQGNTRDVEFPNGDVHRFLFQRNRWHLRKIMDRFGNALTITPVWVNPEDENDGREAKWILADGILDENGTPRQHEVTFIPAVDYTNYPRIVQTGVDRGQLVSSVKLAAKGTGSQYTFTYEPKSIYWGCGHLPGPNADAELRVPEVYLPMLESIGLPDGSSYDFTYYTTEAGMATCGQGALKSATLPTRGKIDYEYQIYGIPDAFCYASTYGNISPGVRSRITPDGRWDYVVSHAQPFTNYDKTYATQQCGPREQTIGVPPANAIVQDPRRWSRTTVLSPEVMYEGSLRRVRTDNYFYTWPSDVGAPLDEYDPDNMNVDGKWRKSFGQPLTSGAPAVSKARVCATPDDPVGCVSELADQSAALADSSNTSVHLSTRTFEGCAADRSGACTAGRQLRSSYLRLGQPKVLEEKGFWPYSAEATRTVFDDDQGCGGNCWVQSTNSQVDGVGNYRQSTTTTNFPGNAGGFSTFTDYASWTDSTIRNPASKWILGLFTHKTRTENGATARTEYCIDPSTGFLNGMRVLKESSRSIADVLTLFTKDAYGNVQTEKTYGGDLQSVDAGSTCPTMSAAPQYSIWKTYSRGLLARAEYCDPAASGSGCTPVLTTLDYDVHPSGLATGARDASGVFTEYLYDAFDRLAEVRPPSGFASSKYEYTQATSVANARVKESLVDGASTLVTTHYEFDRYGRPRRISKSMPNGSLSIVETKYDGLGRKEKVSQPFARSSLVTTVTTLAGTDWTTTTYDAFGRPTAVTAPDASQATVTYTGVRVVQRKTRVATSTTGESEVVTTEHYDAQGRLIKVIEAAADTHATKPQGDPVTTTYGYDVGGRLISVNMSDGPHTQSRTFVYDRRGFLIQETHPERPLTTYSGYDGRGHATTRNDGAAALTFDYDPAERVEAISAGGTPVKTFTFATANVGGNWTKGKLVTAVRRNLLPSGKQIDVTETYAYENAIGAMSKRTTVVAQVAPSAAQIQQFEYSVGYDPLRLPQNVSMPTCAWHGCSTSAGLSSVTSTRIAGSVTAIPGFASALTYHPSGMLESVTHASSPQATDRYAALHGMARPASITFEGGSACPAPSPSAISAADSVCAAASVPALVTARPGITHTWTIQNGTITSAAAGDSITFTSNASGPVVLTVRATDLCGAWVESSKSISVTAFPVATLEASGSTTIVSGSGASVTLVVNLTGQGPWRVEWQDGTVAANVASTPYQRIVSPATTTSYRLQSVTAGGCAGFVSTSSVTVTVIPPSPAQVQAWTVTNRTVAVSWTAVSGAAQYQIERVERIGGTATSPITVAGSVTSFTDTVPATATPTTYLYYVRAVNAQGYLSNRGAFDYATAATSLWAQAIGGNTTVVRGNDVQELRRAVDAFRYAFGIDTPAFGGSSAPSGWIASGDFAALVTAFNAARDAGDYPDFAYATPPALNGVVSAQHVQQLRNALENDR